jgi:Sulfotransferase family
VSVRPLFVLSLPRSGSTLLQRMLSTSPAVATASEPWLLLPQVYALRQDGARAAYGHRTAARALTDFADSLPGGRDAYLEEVRRMALAVYARAAGDAEWFVDKTPRYHLIVDDLMAMFPEARFIFLWRNPLAVAGSIIESFGAGRWNLDRYDGDLRDGLVRLVDAHERHDPRATAVRYEDLVAEPEETVGRLLAFVGASAPADPAAFASVGLAGRMGDRTGRARYSAVVTTSVERWRETMRNPVRRRWCERYLDFLGDDRLARMGYDRRQIRDELDGLPHTASHVMSDVARRLYARSGRTSPWNLRLGYGKSADRIEAV